MTPENIKEQRARDALAFDPLPPSPWLTLLPEGIAITTNYSEALSRLLRGLPNNRWQPEHRRWLLPYVSAPNLRDAIPRIDALNRVRAAMHDVSPFKSEPVDLVLWVPANDVEANDYNPNRVAPPEMRLLEHSVREDGYTQPIVTFLESGEPRTVIDGFHRNRVGREVMDISARLHGRLPVVTANASRIGKADRIAATIRHNRARGKHVVSAMSDIVIELAKRNWSDARIAKELGMDADEVLRLKQIGGLAELFSDRDFSEAWTTA